MPRKAGRLCKAKAMPHVHAHTGQVRQAIEKVKNYGSRVARCAQIQLTVCRGARTESYQMRQAVDFMKRRLSRGTDAPT
jgi:hypothetical protein